jgi:hypothetical protein
VLAKIIAAAADDEQPRQRSSMPFTPGAQPSAV